MMTSRSRSDQAGGITATTKPNNKISVEQITRESQIDLTGLKETWNQVMEVKSRTMDVEEYLKTDRQ
jgi:uncharacterized protein YaaN involved in tellurite resistance